MRLFYQSLGVTRRSTGGDYVQRLLGDPRRRGLARHDHRTARLEPGPGDRRPVRYLEYLDTAEILDNGLAAERDGYDAFLIGNIFEPGMHALRELLNIPVQGSANPRCFSPA